LMLLPLLFLKLIETINFMEAIKFKEVFSTQFCLLSRD
jgi:hypothetical protein